MTDRLHLADYEIVAIFSKLMNAALSLPVRNRVMEEVMNMAVHNAAFAPWTPSLCEGMLDGLPMRRFMFYGETPTGLDITSERDIQEWLDNPGWTTAEEAVATVCHVLACNMGKAPLNYQVEFIENYCGDVRPHVADAIRAMPEVQALYTEASHAD